MKSSAVLLLLVSVFAAMIIACSERQTPTSSSDVISDAGLARGGEPSSCIIVADELVPYVFYNESDCTVTFEWTIGTASDPCRPEVFWGPDTAACWSSPPAGLPYHDVTNVYSNYLQTITINVAGLPIKRLKYRVRSMAQSGSCWLNLPATEQGLAYCDVVVIDSDCEPVIPCEYPCR